MYNDKEDLERAFNKELFIIKNDFYYQQIERFRGDKKELLRIDIAYRAHGALSGDTYSVRKTKDGKVVGFIADAMGKGISAALTAMGTTRFLNYLFDEFEEKGTFSFEPWIRKFLKFIKKNMLEDEMLSISFMEFDINASTLLYATFGMPTFLVVNVQNELMAIKSNNPPIMIYTDDVRIDSLPTNSFSKMLCYSDGLSESFTHDGSLYGSLLKKDFQDACCITDFSKKIYAQIEAADDITYIYVHKVDVLPLAQSITMQSSYQALEESLQCVSEYLKDFSLNPKSSSEIVLALSEMLLNALEHGSFGINKELKNILIEQDIFEAEMARMEKLYYDKMIVIEYGVFCFDGKELFEARITDSGEGFDTRMLKNSLVNAESFNGRGFIIVKKLLDHFYFNEKGNKITLQKFIVKENILT